MGPWSKPDKKKSLSTERRNPAEVMLWVALLALCVLGALGAWMNRYQIGTFGGIPARMNRVTGQVIGCVPLKGCVELIPAGEPALSTPLASHRAAVAAPSPEAAQPETAEPVPAKSEATQQSH